MLNQNKGIWQLVVKTIVVRKSLEPKGSCEFESHLEYYPFFDTSSVNCWLVKKVVSTVRYQFAVKYTSIKSQGIILQFGYSETLNAKLYRSKLNARI